MSPVQPNLPVESRGIRLHLWFLDIVDFRMMGTSWCFLSRICSSFSWREHLSSSINGYNQNIKCRSMAPSQNGIFTWMWHHNSKIVMQKMGQKEIVAVHRGQLQFYGPPMVFMKECQRCLCGWWHELLGEGCIASLYYTLDKYYIPVLDAYYQFLIHNFSW